MTACKEVAAANRVDSPVYTFLTRLTPPELKKLADAAEDAAQAHTKQALAAATDENEKAALTESFADLMASAMKARAEQNFKKARAILGGIKAAQGDQADPFVVQQLALLTYKSKDLEPRDALLQARTILEEVQGAAAITAPSMLQTVKLRRNASAGAKRSPALAQTTRTSDRTRHL